MRILRSNMRSYYEHLKTTSPPPNTPVHPKPVFRSSAIFPVMQLPDISSRILFMGYWILKRNINEISAVITLRDTDGKILTRSDFIIKEAKTFRIELADQLESCGRNRNSDFTGSLEIEFYSSQNLVFPFPAVVINYYGPQFSTVVHTAQRVYNDFDDMSKNSQTAVPESGFNIYANDDREPFIGIINGSVPVEQSDIRMQFFNYKQETLDSQLDIGRLAPYETKIIYPARHFDLKHFLDNKPGTGKLFFNVNWIFPRLLVGNIHHHIPAITITHTYYDCSQADTESDYWKASDKDWYPAALTIPAVIANNHFTNVYFYPIYSPGKFEVDVDIYNAQGNLLATKHNALTITSSHPQFHSIPLKTLCQNLNISDFANCSARIIARPTDSSKLPARIKIGLDIGISDFQTPCNICTNLQPYNPALTTKPTSFRWVPILADQETATVWIMNSSPAIHHITPAVIDMTFFHESDDTTIKRTITLEPNAFIVMHANQDPELKSFFNHTVGWMTAVTSNPYTSIYYFTESPSGVTGGDHGF